MNSVGKGKEVGGPAAVCAPLEPTFLPEKRREAAEDRDQLPASYSSVS